MKQKQSNPNQGFNWQAKPQQVRTAPPAEKEAGWDHRDRHTGKKTTT